MPRAECAPKLTGVILDQKTQEPIPYAWVDLKDQETRALADSLGRFTINPSSLLLPDTLIVNGVGYKPARQAFTPNDPAKAVEIALSPIVVPVAPLVLPSSGKIKLITLGARSKEPGEGMIQDLPGGHQYALFIKNEKGEKLGDICSVSFFMGDNGHPREKFRVRVYRAVGSPAHPGPDLLLKSLVVSAPKGGQWFSVDLTPYNIEAPTEGFFVAMEWIMGSKVCDTSSDSYTPCGQVMRPTFEFKESRTWNYTIGRDWSLITLANGNGRRYNAMIKAEVDLVK